MIVDKESGRKPMLLVEAIEGAWLLTVWAGSFTTEEEKRAARDRARDEWLKRWQESRAKECEAQIALMAAGADSMHQKIAEKMGESESWKGEQEGSPEDLKAKIGAIVQQMGEAHNSLYEELEEPLPPKPAECTVFAFLDYGEMTSFIVRLLEQGISLRGARENGA